MNIIKQIAIAQRHEEDAYFEERAAEADRWYRIRQAEHDVFQQLLKVKEDVPATIGYFPTTDRRSFKSLAFPEGLQELYKKLPPMLTDQKKERTGPGYHFHWDLKCENASCEIEDGIM